MFILFQCSAFSQHWFRQYFGLVPNKGQIYIIIHFRIDNTITIWFEFKIFNVWLFFMQQFCLQQVFARKNIIDSSIFKLLPFLPHFLTSCEGNIFLHRSHHIFRLHFPWKDHIISKTIMKWFYSANFEFVSLVFENYGFLQEKNI